ncbi:sodium:alanine symporter family protein [Gammaproteobacteria bacterium]|jgi:AGCS family alanine or glycine:cation symporter|nr:sodium:alanine symporter family protein [Gammaproteobacteria bacterium]MDA9815210.1 sodium:alanine symporter family protein [Gammaproteobacteria bacterium]MDA9902818.1 sodium:alanine symporter family protein [Gammaproteobacteria bacterium]MDC0402366.1 sodium:alanine symporter family protein [Gammaproteobacteria bacterium]MDC1074451.1 sodium:alanine symporter family protein [Gammaproteobacteria bacterium]
MTQFNDFLLLLDSNLSGSWWFPILLVGTGIFFTIYLGFPQFRFFGKAWKLVSGKNNKSDEEGETTGFEALTTAMSGAVGTGNIGGVALAIWTGGPAAIFWMWITAIFGMTTKFVEVTMGHKYRTKLEDGSISGGPMYYIEHALNMKWAGILFAFLMMITAIGSGNMPQINNIALVMNTEFSVPKIFTGLFLGALLWIIIIGGIKRIASVASKIIPIMGLIYLGGALIILLENYQNIIPSFNAIFAQVFTGSAAVGGFLGASFAMSLKYGVARGLYSNEAGQGSSPIAHASSKNTSIDQGVVSILEPFIDTIVVCSVTALVILSSGVWTEKFDTTFSKTDMVILDGIYSDKENIDGNYLYPDHMNQLTKYVQYIDSDVDEYSGVLEIRDGTLITSDITVLHSRSIAENVIVTDKEDKSLYTGFLNVENGKVQDAVTFQGKSLVSSAELTAKAFSQGIFGQFGGKLVAIALLLFAFSTAITWCYYGDRSTAYIFGERGVFWYRNFYVLCFILAAVIDTTIVWNIAYVVVALVSIPNLIALFVLRNEMKDLTKEFISKY